MAKETTDSEANKLAEIYFLAEWFSDPERARVGDIA
jgi:hypothetical protein